MNLHICCNIYNFPQRMAFGGHLAPVFTRQIYFHRFIDNHEQL